MPETNELSSTFLSRYWFVVTLVSEKTGLTNVLVLVFVLVSGLAQEQAAITL